MLIKCFDDNCNNMIDLEAPLKNEWARKCVVVLPDGREKYVCNDCVLRVLGPFEERKNAESYIS